MASIILAGSTSGSITISSPSVSGTNTLTLPANTGTVITTASTFAGTGPAFSAYLSADQTITSSTFTKVQFNAELFDTNNNFDSTTNYRFTPTIAGYYQINFVMSGSNSTAATRAFGALYKNGSIYINGSDSTVAAGQANSSASVIVSMNGSTDYIELYAYIIATTAKITSFASSNYTQMTGSLIRSA